MRLIDADALKEELNNWAVDLTKSKFPHYIKDDADCIIDNAPAIDAVPVVRCKDCRHAVDYYHEGDCYCSNPKWGLNYFGGSWEFYCADAERRNNEID